MKRHLFAMFIGAAAAVIATASLAMPAHADDRGVAKAAQAESIPVLNYHSIGDDADNSLVLSPKKLQEQMDYLAKHGFTPLRLSDFTLILEKKKQAPRKPVLLTFDDGYEDNYTLAKPILAEYGFPATLFVSPGSVGHAPYLSWEQIKELQAAGWDIEPHGMTHPHLPKLSPEEQQYQIAESRRQIEERLGTTADVFCYPYGEYNRHTLDILQKEGFRYAFTTHRGRASASQNPFKLRRIYVDGKDSLDAWSKKLSGKYLLSYLRG